MWSPNLSLIFFTDDLILFVEGSPNQAAIILDCLDRFCDASGQAVGYGKSAIFCSKNIDRRTTATISSTLGIPLTQDLGRYLGVPVLHERVTKHTYQDVIDRIDQRLSGWKAKSLTLAGRVTLAQSVLSAIPAYVMQTSVLQGATCEAIDKRIRDFVWGSTKDAKKRWRPSWDRICTPKENGGLGLLLARELNRAFMTKLAFTFFQNEDLLWVRILQSKYFHTTSDGLQLKKSVPKSDLWRGLYRDWPSMIRGIRSAVRNGKGTLFWSARWIDSGELLMDLIEGDPNSINHDETIADMVGEDGQWDWDRLANHLPSDALDKVVGMSPPRPEAREDEWIWGLEGNGKFSIKSAYCLIRNCTAEQDASLWNRVWNWKGPNKIRHFIWLVAHDRLLTNQA
ncbi:Putative ribonuclease H protein At1g65750 [Linum perenne]